MTVTADADPKVLLQHHQNQLANAIAALIDPRPETHNGDTIWTDSIYTELRAAVHGARAGSQTGGPAQSQPPLWIDGMDLLAVIDDTTKRWVRRGHGPEHPTVNRLRYIDGRKWRPQDTPVMADIAAQIGRWVTAYRKLVDDKPLTLPNPCPNCQNTHAYRWQDGERIRTPALHVTPDRCVCQACRTEWPAAHYGLLARQLGYQPLPGVLT